MDSAKLAQVVAELLDEDSKLGIQPHLNNLRNTLQNLQGNPADPNLQISAKSQVDTLLQSSKTFKFERDPIFATYVKAIKGDRYFSRKMADEIIEILETNGMTPAVANQHLTSLYNDRDNYVAQLTALSGACSALSVGKANITEGESQIGFRIPRDIFHNEFKEWIGELNEIRRIVRPFSEVITGSFEPLKLGEISSTDPIVFLILKPLTVAALAKAVSWSIDQWKNIEDIRKVRAETAKIKSETDEFKDILEQFDKKIQETIAAAIEKYSDELAPSGGKPGRPKELYTEMKMALTSLVARVERGMTVEIKFLPPAQAGNDESAAAYTDMANVVPTLTFPPASPSPILKLPRPPANDDQGDYTD